MTIQANAQHLPGLELAWAELHAAGYQPGDAVHKILAQTIASAKTAVSKLPAGVPAGWNVYRDKTGAIYVGVSSGRLPGVWLYRDGSMDERMLWAYFDEVLDAAPSAPAAQSVTDHSQRALIRLAMNLLSLRNHVPGSDVDLCVKALADLLEGKYSPAPEPSEAWREVAEIAHAEAPAVVNQQVTAAAIAPDALEQARRHLSNAIEDAEDGKTAAALPALREVSHYLAQAATPPAMDRQANEAGMHTLDAICDLFMIGKDARTHICVMTNIENTHKFAKLLHAIESEFFMVPGEPDEDYPDEEPSDDCLLNCWGSTQEQYVEQFRAALPAVAKQHLIAAARDVLAERQRQITAEGYDSSNDDMATRGQLAIAAGCYAIWSGHPALMGTFSWKSFFPWDWKYWKPSTPRHNLIRAGALILAEIERLDRAEQAKQQEQQ